MVRQMISTGSSMEAEAGYSRAIVDGDWCFVSGTTGYNYDTMVMPETLTAQTHNCFSTIKKTLGEAGFELSDIVRIRYFVTSRAYADEAFPIFGKYLSDIRPAATLIICELLRPEMKIEIEVTAKKPESGFWTGTSDPLMLFD
ncbi:Enamine deaminase RidA, house cleaning of reactive enamine intermediates, YjgF/YER057c/UK114 family [Cohaesibacter sp. ES.047]|uniref:RidA family protein n=1 Tax=Cohaesibacter sp. ES.047 TaxID=1798205 RepID=UPI000BB6A353|nr:RidA family protein [Cohaesibacter sp. ES.047]SNY90124.1 Enamine deaminase RidA, house cleaning of reactive enamine intermediates, YjgF/YER057c/UK114 family [Cohaesibacter sp. ES.047]